MMLRSNNARMCHKMVVLLTLALFICKMNALQQHKKLSTKRNLVTFEEFGFGAHGTISLNGTVQPSTETSFVKVMVCGLKEYTRMLTLRFSQKDPAVCNSGSQIQSRCRFFDLSTEMKAPVTITHKDLYHLILVHCSKGRPKVPVTVDISYQLLNPGGQELPLGSEPLPKLYFYLSHLWVMLIVFGGVFIIAGRKNRTPMHSIFATIAFLKLTVVVIDAVYYRIYAKEGKRYDSLSYMRSFVYAVAETLFFCAILLIAKGWRITRAGLPMHEIRTVVVMVVVLLSFLLFFSFYNSDYYFLSLMIMYFFMLPKIFTSISRNKRLIEAQMTLLRGANGTVDISHLVTKLVMFNTLRGSVLLYLGSILLVNSMRIMRLWYLNWISISANEIITAVMVWTVFYIIRPRLNGVFSGPNDVIMPFDRLQRLMDVHNANDDEDPNGRVEPYDMEGTNSIVVQWPSIKGEPGLVPMAVCVAETDRVDEILRDHLQLSRVEKDHP